MNKRERQSDTHTHTHIVCAIKKFVRQSVVMIHEINELKNRFVSGVHSDVDLKMRKINRLFLYYKHLKVNHQQRIRKKN